MNEASLHAHPGDVVRRLAAWHPATQQAVFRQLMRAFSYPGRVETLYDGDSRDDTDADIDGALQRVLATLLDGEVTVADPDGLIGSRANTLLEARSAAPETAQFVVARADRAPRFTPTLGTLESPERGATLILLVATLGAGAVLDITGPGVDGTTCLRVHGMDPAWLAWRAELACGFPLGVDMILVDTRRAAALPRTARIVPMGEH